MDGATNVRGRVDQDASVRSIAINTSGRCSPSLQSCPGMLDSKPGYITWALD